MVRPGALTLKTPLLSQDEKHILPLPSPSTYKPNTLLHIHEVPVWMHDNEYLLSGYRPVSSSLKASFQSAFGWHNQTININSHLIGALIFLLVLPVHFYKHVLQPLNDESAAIDALLFLTYFIGVAICFGCSAAYHSIHNHALCKFGCQLDYVGIVALMWGAALPSIYYAFPCHHGVRLFYWIEYTALAIGAVVMTINPSFDRPQSRNLRVVLYTSLGLSGLVFVAHSVGLYGLAAQQERMSLNWMAIMATLNLVGAMLYVARFPERWFPYRFDLLGSSHQIFHVLVFAAAVAHYVGLVKAMRFSRGGVEAGGDMCDAAEMSGVVNVLGQTVDAWTGMFDG